MTEFRIGDEIKCKLHSNCGGGIVTGVQVTTVTFRNEDGYSCTWEKDTMELVRPSALQKGDRVRWIDKPDRKGTVRGPEGSIVHVDVDGDGLWLARSQDLELIGRPESEEPVSVRAGVLREAETLITGDRNAAYGSPTQNFQNTADLWNTQFGHKLKPGQEFTSSDIAQAMVHLKMARLIASPKRDNWVDIAGYAGCGAECEEGSYVVDATNTEG